MHNAAAHSIRQDAWAFMTCPFGVYWVGRKQGQLAMAEEGCQASGADRHTPRRVSAHSRAYTFIVSYRFSSTWPAGAPGRLRTSPARHKWTAILPYTLSLHDALP